MAEQEFYRQTIVIDLNGDEVTAKKLKAMDVCLKENQKHAKALDGTKVKPAVDIQDKASAKISKIFGGLKGLIAMAGVSGLAIKGAFFAKESLDKAIQFQAELSTIKALAGLTNNEMASMQNLALQMGAKTKYSAQEAAKGIEELIKAGLDPAGVKSGGLEAALNLATAGELGLADAAAIMSNALNAYRSDAMTAAQAADILAGTANASATSVQELQYSLAMVSPVASGVGMSFRDTNIALGLLANYGLKGSDAGTSLKTALMNLQPTTKRQTDLFKRLGIITSNGSNKFYTAAGRLKSLDEITDVIQTSFKGFTDQQRMAYMEAMFGADAIRAVNILYKQGTQGVKDFARAMGKVSALDVAREKMNNAAGEIEQFRGALETLHISGMLPILPLVKRLASGAADLTAKITPTIIKAMDQLDKYYTNLMNDNAFKKLDPAGKIVFILEDAINKITPVAIDLGIKLGEAMAKGIITGTAAMLKKEFTDRNTFNRENITRFILGPVIGGGVNSLFPDKNTIPEHASGGIFTRPHLGLFAEKGPEGLVPLATSQRRRALNIWSQIGNQLGVSGQMQPAFGGGAGLNLSIGNVNVDLGGGQIDEDALALKIGRQIVARVKKAIENKV